MISKLRIWRVVPTSETGAQAPSFIVETQDDDLTTAERRAIKLGREKSALGKFDEWCFRVTKLDKKKDGFGRYFPNRRMKKGY